MGRLMLVLDHPGSLDDIDNYGCVVDQIFPGHLVWKGQGRVLGQGLNAIGDISLEM